MPRRRPRRRKTQPVITAPEPESGRLSLAQIEALLREDPRFQVLSVDSLSWIDPYTGTLIPAPFDFRRTAAEWLMRQRPWQTREHVLSQRQLRQLRWHHFLRESIREEKRLRGFAPGNRWLNPYTGEWEDGVPFNGTITKETLAALAALLASCEKADRGRLLSREVFDRLLAEAKQHTRRQEADRKDANAGNETAPLDRRLGQGASTDHLPSPSGANPLLPDPEVAKDTAAKAAQLIAGYRILSRLGEGGMGVIYLARQMSMERDVALKILRGEHISRPTFQERFLREARVAGSISHPHIVTIYDVGKHGGLVYMSMEYMEGGDALRQANKQGGTLTEKQALTIMIETVEGLAALHDAGLVHRDVKPTNIFLTRDGHAKLGDMGLVLERSTDDGAKQRSAVGTPSYMAPEQADGQPGDPRTDIYGVGATLFALLAGRPPFDGESPYEIFKQVLSEPAPDLRECSNHVGDVTATAVARCLQKNRNDRYPTTTALLADLRTALQTASDLQGDPTVSRRGRDVPTISVDVTVPTEHRHKAVDIGIHHSCVDHCSFLHQNNSRKQTSWWCGHLDDPDIDRRLQYLRSVPAMIDAAATVEDALRTLEQCLPEDAYLHLQIVEQLDTPHRFRVWTCGVEAVWLYQADHDYTLRRLGHDQDALGSGAREWQASDVVLRPGGTMLLYTPGVIDCEDLEGQTFGIMRLAAQLLQLEGEAVELARAIGDAMNEHCDERLQEDAALIVLREPGAEASSVDRDGDPAAETAAQTVQDGEP